MVSSLVAARDRYKATKHKLGVAIDQSRHIAGIEGLEACRADHQAAIMDVMLEGLDEYVKAAAEDRKARVRDRTVMWVATATIAIATVVYVIVSVIQLSRGS